MSVRQCLGKRRDHGATAKYRRLPQQNSYKTLISLVEAGRNFLHTAERYPQEKREKQI